MMALLANQIRANVSIIQLFEPWRDKATRATINRRWQIFRTTLMFNINLLVADFVTAQLVKDVHDSSHRIIEHLTTK